MNALELPGGALTHLVVEYWRWHTRNLASAFRSSFRSLREPDDRRSASILEVPFLVPFYYFERAWSDVYWALSEASDVFVTSILHGRFMDRRAANTIQKAWRNFSYMKNRAANMKNRAANTIQKAWRKFSYLNNPEGWRVFDKVVWNSHDMEGSVLPEYGDISLHNWMRSDRASYNYGGRADRYGPHWLYGPL